MPRKRPRRSRSSSRPPAASEPDRFHAFAQASARLAGKPVAFLAAAGLVVLWAAAGPVTGYSEGWQLTINTVTTIVTFLMVFLIQNTQNRDTLAVQTSSPSLS